MSLVSPPLPPASGPDPLRARLFQPRVLAGGLTMLAGSATVTVLNLVYNVGVARSLGPAAFGHIAAIYTLLMLTSAISLSFQMVCAKVVAQNQEAGAQVRVYHDLRARAWRYGLALGTGLLLFSWLIADYLNLPSAWLLVPLGVAVTFYVPLGARRGAMLGVCAFRRVAASLALEAAIKLAGAILAVTLGYGVAGVVWAMALSVVLAHLLPRLPAALQAEPTTAGVRASFREAMQAIVFFVGQVIISNLDIVLVKHFFAPEQAGLYATAALVGRAMYFLAWSVTAAMFPISAGEQARGTPLRGTLLSAFGLVFLITASFTTLLFFFSTPILRLVFGPMFHQIEGQPHGTLMVLYSLNTGLYALSVVLIAYEMSRKIANTGWLQLAVSGAVAAGIYAFHADLLQVLQVQSVAMLLLLGAVFLPFLWSRRRRPRPAPAPRTVLFSKVRPLREPEVVAEFLRNEFYQAQYDAKRETHAGLVLQPDLSNEAENRARRELLLFRRGAMWRQLPADTRWWEVRLDPGAMQGLRIFPRAQWRQFARHGFSLPEVARSIRERGRHNGNGELLARLLAMGRELPADGPLSTVLLIGIDERQPLTIIEGNHRMAAALLCDDPEWHLRYRFLCGLSPHMDQCCWYDTNLRNLLRYAAQMAQNPGDLQHTDLVTFWKGYATRASSSSDARGRKPQAGRKEA